MQNNKLRKQGMQDNSVANIANLKSPTNSYSSHAHELRVGKLCNNLYIEA